MTNTRLRNNPCFECICMPICRQKDNFPKFKGECKIVNKYFYGRSEIGFKNGISNKESALRIAAVCKQIDAPWKVSLISFLKNEHDLDYEDLNLLERTANK